MKIGIYLGLPVLAVALFALGRTTAENHPAFTPNTLESLTTATHGEAFAYAKYMLYAQHARENGHPELADLFEKTAKVERFEHFAEEAKLAGVVGSDEDNLRDAIKGESYEVDTMYREFAQKAAAAGDKQAAQRFEEVRHDEIGHRDAFKAALAKLERP